MALHKQSELAALRAEIDRLDDALHDTLMRRAEVVARIGGLGVKGRSPLRPGREAAVLRRLLARHSGPMPRSAVARIWREIVAGSSLQQGGFIIAVFNTEPGTGYLQAAREQYGALTPMRVHRSPAHAIGDVSVGEAVAAVLPLPAEEDGPGSWWTALMHQPEDAPRIHVVARLPFWERRSEAATPAAVVVAAVPPDPSGDDRTLIAFEAAGDVSRARLIGALEAAGLTPDTLLRRREGDVLHVLVDCAGAIPDNDPRLASLSAFASRPPVVLGSYAVPIRGD